VAGQKQFSYEPEKLADDLYGIPLPLHDGSPVNAYVAIDEAGLWLVDGGLGDERCQAVLRRGIESLGYAFDKDVRGLLITHGHNDHVGAAEAIAAQGGEILAHRLEWTASHNLAFDESWLHKHGLPAESLTRTDRWRPAAWPQPSRLLEDGDCVRWGGLNLEVVWCPGHTPGLVCLLERDRRLLFTTDHVMRRAPAPVSIRYDASTDPLSDYLHSVRKLAPLPVQTVLPGHGRPFHGLSQRLAHIETEIQHQLDEITEHLRTGPATAYELLSVKALRDHRRPIASRYAVSLVLARLRYLESIGLVERVESQDLIRYALAHGELHEE